MQRRYNIIKTWETSIQKQSTQSNLCPSSRNNQQCNILIPKKNRAKVTIYRRYIVINPEGHLLFQFQQTPNQVKDLLHLIRYYQNETTKSYTLQNANQLQFFFFHKPSLCRASSKTLYFPTQMAHLYHLYEPKSSIIHTIQHNSECFSNIQII